MKENSLMKYFKEIDDPRSGQNMIDPLEDIFFITLCGVIVGADTWNEIETFALKSGRSKVEKNRKL